MKITLGSKAKVKHGKGTEGKPLSYTIVAQLLCFHDNQTTIFKLLTNSAYACSTSKFFLEGFVEHI